MKASRIMVCPTVHLPSVLTDAERDVLRKVLLDNIRGIDRFHDKRWRRFVGALINSQPGEVTDFINPRTRSLPFHKRWMAIERAIYDNQDAFQTLGGFRRWLKCGAGLGEYHLVGDRMVFVPGSVSFEEASDDEMREFVKAAEEFLHTPLAQRRLWRHLSADRRAEMVEALLANPNEHEEHAS
jgi:hypothetical protein